MINIIFNEESEVKIDIYKWKGEDRVEIEINYSGFNPLTLETSSMREADLFIKSLKKAIPHGSLDE